MKYLELPMTFHTVVRSAFEDQNCVVIEQPDGDDEPIMTVMLHRSQVPAVIVALRQYLGDGDT